MGRLPPPSYAQATGAVDASRTTSPGIFVPNQRPRFVIIPNRIPSEVVEQILVYRIYRSRQTLE